MVHGNLAPTCHFSLFCWTGLKCHHSNSQLRPWRENKQKHEQLNLSFWRLFLHFCEYISTSLQSFKAVKKMFIVFLMKLCIFYNFELMTFYHVQGQTHVSLKLVILMLNKQT